MNYPELPPDASRLLLADSARGNAFCSVREVYRSVVRTNATKVRRAASSELFLMRRGDSTPWYNLQTDELIGYHAGSPMLQTIVFPDGSVEERLVGPFLAAGEFPQSVIPFGAWRRFRILEDEPHELGLFSSVVVPGFEAADYREASCGELIERGILSEVL